MIGRFETVYMAICLVCGVWIVVNRLSTGERIEALYFGIFALVAMLLPMLRVLVLAAVDLFRVHRG